MHAADINAMILALSKHEIGGIVGIVAGVVVLVFGALRVLKSAAGAMMLAFFGIVILVLGILAYTHTI